MKYIIRENRIPKLISKYIFMTYGELNQVYDRDSNKIEWFRKDENPNETYGLFELNASGTLFVPNQFKRTIGDLFGFEYQRELDNAIKECWDYMFGVYPNRVNIYFT